MNVRVTHHAAERYVERIAPGLSIEQATIAIEGAAPAIAVAVAFGCKVVRLGNGARLCLKGLTVVTVMDRQEMPRDLLPARRGAPAHG